MKYRSFPWWNYTEYVLLRCLVGLLNLLPIGISTRIVRWFAGLLYFLMVKRRKIALQNLELAFNNTLDARGRKRIAREVFRNVATSLMEFFRIPSMIREADKRFEFEGTEYLDQAFARGKGVIFVISHLGSWEYLEFLPYLRGYPCSAVVRYVKNRYIYKWIQRLRRKTKLHPIDREGSIREILRALRQNHLVAILIDQWAGNEGIWLDFFGRATSTTSIPARLANQTGAAVIPGYCLRTAPGHYKIVIKPEVALEGGREDFEVKTTRKLNQLLEEAIREHPTQWIWGHRRWK